MLEEAGVWCEDRRLHAWRGMLGFAGLLAKGSVLADGVADKSQSVIVKGEVLLIG